MGEKQCGDGEELLYMTGELELHGDRYRQNWQGSNILVHGDREGLSGGKRAAWRLKSILVSSTKFEPEVGFLVNLHYNNNLTPIHAKI